MYGVQHATGCACGRERRNTQNFGGEIYRTENTWEHKDLDGTIVLNGSSKRGRYGMDWIYLAQDRNRWSAVLKRVIKL